jgi:hypothetical protein
MKSPRNGSSRIEIHTDDMGGWVRVFTDPQQTYHGELPVYLSHALTAWFRQRAHLRLALTLSPRFGVAPRLDQLPCDTLR